MITTGIIREINLSSSGYQGNKYLVELNLFQIPGDENKSHYTYQANCALPGGLYQSYNVNDMVYVGFVNDELSFPIILGRIYKGLDNNYRSHALLGSLSIQSSAVLPTNTQIGEFTYSQLKESITLVNSQNIEIEQIKKDINNKSLNSYSEGNIPSGLMQNLKNDILNMRQIIVNSIVFNYLKTEAENVIYQAVDYDIENDAVTFKFARIYIINSMPNSINIINKTA